ncbi:Acylglycerol kinase, mitochondrial [Lamellibrachia satsuma]|nr:Acylglycerol kinase, mitochondrial [Lamellibrachia satsuma]
MCFSKQFEITGKKSVFFTCVAVYGGKFLNTKYEESLIRRAYCLEALKYGNEPLKTGERARRVTVFLNPAASGGKGKALFEKNAAPLLYMAGLDVTVIKTEYEGQAKHYMDVLDNTDAVVVAGGDGTLSEVVTGLLRKCGEEKCRLPIGIVPVGATNSLAKILFGKDDSNVRWMADAAMSVIKGTTKDVDVLFIKGEGEGKNVYALSGIEWGAYKDAEHAKKRYWYFGPLKHRLTYVLPSTRQWPPVISANLAFTPPCLGCSKCYTPPPKVTWKWWHIFLQPHREVQQKDYSDVDNPECGKWYSDDISTVQFIAMTTNHLPANEETTGSAIIRTWPSDISKKDFIKDGWRRMKGEASDLPIETCNVSEFSLKPDISEGKEAWFTIDNELYEAMPINVKLLRDRIKVFCLPQHQTTVANTQQSLEASQQNIPIVA